MALALSLALPAVADAQRARKFSGPTYSSPIALSADGRYVWAVNPGADTVSVIYTRNNRVVRTVAVGDEPESVALDPNNRYAYVANAAAGTVSVIRITRARGRSVRAREERRVGRRGELTTGAEPFNIVSSPDGRRVFVANSAQDTITVIDATAREKRIVGSVNLRGSACSRDRNRHFQPRGLAVTQDSRKLYVTGFLSFVRPGGRQADDNGKEGVVCRLDVSTRSTRIRRYRPAARTTLGAQVTGFTVDANGDGAPDSTSAFPNQLQSIVLRAGQAYLPNIAASPDGPVRFNVNTQAFVNVIDGVRGRRQTDASAAKFLNLHLGARNPEPGKKRLFFANAWAIAFTSQRGAGAAYVVSAGSDLLVKVNVGADGKLAFTTDADTTRYVDLNDPANAATSGANAGKNPQGIVINRNRAYVANRSSRNVSVVNLSNDTVQKVIRTAPPPAPGSQAEVVAVGRDMFFSSRGVFNRPAGTTASTTDRLASEGWQSCASCHFEGVTDGVVWEFPSGPRKSVPLNATFNPRNRQEQRVLNYSAIFDEVEDFELNIRNVSGPGALATAAACATPPPATSVFDPNHGLLLGDDGNANLAPCAINALAKPNAGRPQHTVTPAGSNTSVPALTALKEWVRFAVRTPNAPLTRNRVRSGVREAQLREGRRAFEQAGCANCHLGGKFTLSTKDFTSPPAATEISTETAPAPTFGSPVAVQSLSRFLRNVGSFNRGVPGSGNELGSNVGGEEKAAPNLTAGTAGPRLDALGVDYNGDGKGVGYNVPSLLGIEAVAPYYHNGACETLACVVGDAKHRTANGTAPDRLTNARQRALVTTFLRSIDARTAPAGG